MAEISKPMAQEPITDPTEAIKKFRPFRDGVQRLREILELRAAPNATIGTVSILQNVMCFASADNMEIMHKLLLEKGAVETDADKKRLEERRRADVSDSIREKEFFEDEREFNPWDGRWLDF